MRGWLPILVAVALCTSAFAQNRRAAPAGDPAAAAAFSSLDAALAAAKSDDPKQQIAAANWIAATKPDAAAAVPALVPLLDKATLGRELQMRVIRVNPATAAFQALSALGPAAIPPLVSALDGAPPAARANILLLLSHQRDKADAKVLSLMIGATKDTDATVRMQAATGLLWSNTPEAVEALLPKLDDTDAGVRTAAANSLGFAAVQKVAGKPISNFIQAKAVKKLGEVLKDADKNVRISAAESLGRLRSGNAVEALCAVLDDADVRTVAVQSLGNIGNSRATPAVIRVLKLKDAEDTRTAKALAAQALGKLVDVRAVNPLIAALKDPDESVRQWAAESLGLIGDRRALAPLVEVLNDKDVKRQFVRVSAARSLGRLDDPRGVEPLIAALADPITRHEAARALGGLRDPRAIEPLAKVLFDDSPGNQDQEICAWAISQVRDPRAVRALVEGAIAHKDQTGATHIVRRTLDKLLDTSFVSDGDQPAKWWAEHKHEYADE